MVPYLPTPVRADGALATEELERLIDYLQQFPISGFSPLGSTGEGVAISDEVAQDTIATTRRAAASHLPVIPGVAVQSGVKRAVSADELGAAGLVVICQSTETDPQADMIRQVEAVADGTTLPLVLYRQPALGQQLGIDSILQLSQIPAVVAIKDAASDTGFLLEAQESGVDLDIYAASAQIALFVFQLGAIGWMSGPACVAPDSATRLYRAFAIGDWETAWTLQRGLWPLCRTFVTFGPAPVVKWALGHRGFNVGPPVNLNPLGTDGQQQVLKSLQHLQLARSSLGLKETLL